MKAAAAEMVASIGVSAATVITSFCWFASSNGILGDLEQITVRKQQLEELEASRPRIAPNASRRCWKRWDYAGTR